MRKVRRVILLAVFLILQATISSAAEPPPIVITTDGAALTATGLTPNAPVVVLVGWWTKSYGSTSTAQTLRDSTASAGGELSVTLDRPIPQTALIAVADVASGRFAVIDVGEPRFRRRFIEKKRFKRGPDNDYDDVTLPHERALIVVVRPGVGAWVHDAGDGGVNDDDGTSDGWIRTNPERMQPIAQSPAAPKKIKPKDLVLVLDTYGWSFEATEVPQ